MEAQPLVGSDDAPQGEKGAVGAYWALLLALATPVLMLRPPGPLAERAKDMPTKNAVGASVCYCLGGGTFSDGCVLGEASRSVELRQEGYGKLRRVFGSRSVFASSCLGQRRCGWTLPPTSVAQSCVSLAEWSLRRGEISTRCNSILDLHFTPSSPASACYMLPGRKGYLRHRERGRTLGALLVDVGPLHMLYLE
jgi:hypothetical protein